MGLEDSPTLGVLCLHPLFTLIHICYGVSEQLLIKTKTTEQSSNCILDNFTRWTPGNFKHPQEVACTHFSNHWLRIIVTLSFYLLVFYKATILFVFRKVREGRTTVINLRMSNKMKAFV